MQFFLLILFNIFMGAILYLIISLKLERSATEFRSKRFRQEMDEIIKEFNSAAERNITILENRISVLQRLLERTGGLKSLDVSIGDPEDSSTHPAPPPPKTAASPSVEKKARSSDVPPEINNAVSNDRGMLSLTTRVMGRMKDGLGAIIDSIEKRQTAKLDAGTLSAEADGAGGEAVHGRSPDVEEVQSEETILLDEEEIREMINSSRNRYEAITALHLRGYSLETISRCSGIPAGEISLVLNLNVTRND